MALMHFGKVILQITFEGGLNTFYPHAFGNEICSASSCRSSYRNYVTPQKQQSGCFKVKKKQKLAQVPDGLK